MPEDDDLREVTLADNEWKALSAIRSQGFWIIVLLVTIVLELALVIGRL